MRHELLSADTGIHGRRITFSDSQGSSRWNFAFESSCAVSVSVAMRRRFKTVFGRYLAFFLIIKVVGNEKASKTINSDETEWRKQVPAGQYIHFKL